MNNVNNNGLKPGALLRHNTYRIERILGQGGFGITYLATDLSLERYVAIKEFFPKDYCDREESTSHITVGTSSNVELVSRLKAKFLKEARNIAKFDHPGIIKIHTAFEENNTAYYVMDYIEGSNLNEIVKRSGALSESEAVNYITQVGDALDYIHKHNVNHLDIKPANIMIRKSDDRPILIDFGLSKQYDNEGNQTSTTPTGISHGYAPMEQYKVGGVSEFSPQTDVYSLAATLFFLISGKIPPHATDLIEENITFPAGFPTNLQKTISKAMSSARKGRHESVAKFISEITLGEEPEETQIIQATPTHNVEVNIETPVPTNIRLHQILDRREHLNQGYSSKTSKGSTLKKGKSNSKILIIGACSILAILVCLLCLFNRENNQNISEATSDIVSSQEKEKSLEEQMNLSTPVIVETPNYNATNSNSILTPPKVKKVSQKYVDPVAETDEWISLNSIETYSPLLDARPAYYNYENTLSSLGKLPVPRIIKGQYLRFWKQDSHYNYFAYGTESYVEVGAVRLFIMNKENTKVLFDYQFDNYVYPPKIVEADRNFVDFDVSNFTLQNGILYFSFYHRTYAYSSHGMNGYISALDTDSNKISWISKPLVCNANFIIDGDYIITGYGFTDEPDFLYILDKSNGSIISKTSLANGPDLIGINGNHIFVRTYSYEYDFVLTR